MTGASCSYAVLGLPVAGEVEAYLAEAISVGQPMVLMSAGRPVGVLIDIDSYLEATSFEGGEL